MHIETTAKSGKYSIDNNFDCNKLKLLLEKEIFSEYDYCELDASLPACIFYENRGFRTVKHVKYDIGNGAFMIYEIMRKYKG